MGVFFEFDVGGTGDQGFDMESREGDEVGLGLVWSVRWGESKKGVADLFDVDSAGEGGLLGIVALKLIGAPLEGWSRTVSKTQAYLDTTFGVCYAVCCHRRVMADLFRDELCLASVVLPGAKEELAQKWI